MLRSLAAVLVAVVLATGCGGADGPERSWRDLELTLPDGWVVFEDEPTRFSVADGPLGEDAGDRGRAEAAAFFTADADSRPDDWRELVAGTLEGTMEVDRSTEVGGLPATKLVFSHESNGVPMREMVVLIPSREIVILLQPVVTRDQQDGPAVFDAHLAEFEALLSSLRFGAPVSASGGARGDGVGAG